MAKWVYERWSIKWDISDPDNITQSVTATVFEIDIATLESAAVGTAPEERVMCLASNRKSDYDAGLVTWVYYGYAGERINIPQFNVSKTTLAHRRLKDGRLEDVILEEGTVPDDGIHIDGYWYIKVKPAFPTMRIMRDGQWAEVETGFVLKDGVWKPIEEIYKLQDGQWVQA